MRFSDRLNYAGRLTFITVAITALVLAFASPDTATEFFNMYWPLVACYFAICFVLAPTLNRYIKWKSL